MMSALVAQGQEPVPHDREASRKSALGVRQQQVSRMMLELEAAFLELAQTLDASEPDRAERVVKALEQAQERLLKNRMVQIEHLLDGAQLDGAVDEQQRVISDLKRLMDLLLNEAFDPDPVQDEIERLQEWQQRVHQLLKEQQHHLDHSTRAAGQPQTSSAELQKMANGQDSTADKAAQLADTMARAPSDQPSSESQFEPHVGSAQQHMQQASGQLRAQRAGSAAQPQKDAIDELQKALDAIEERLSELEEEAQDEQRAELESYFHAMLTRQRKVTQATQQLDQKTQGNDGKLRRKDRIVLRKQVEEERQLAALAEQALELLTQDGTGIVFPRVVAQLRDELQQVAVLLADRQTGNYTQALQHEIERILEELTEALQSSAGSNGGAPNEGQGEQGQEGGDETPLLTDTAEFKLLRSLQLHINRRTTAFATADGDLEDGDPENGDPDRDLRNLAELQMDVANLVQEMIHRRQPTPRFERVQVEAEP